MAEIFVVNKSAALDGAYVSDLPVTNSSPAARQIAFYIASAYTEYETAIDAYLAACGGVPTATGADVIANILTNTAIDEVTLGATYGSGSVEDVLRILVGADGSAGSIEESANLGNHRILGGATRRLYTRDRVDASIHEGFLRAQLDAGSIVIYNVDGSVAHS